MSSLVLAKPTLMRARRPLPTPADLTVRKSAGAIQVWDTLSLLQRKIFAVLLLNAYEELPDFGIISHQIGLKVLSHLSGFNSKNTKYLKDALTAMVSTPVQWDILNSDGKTSWAVSATLASARIEDGVITYAFSPEMRKRLYKPEAYGLLNANVIRQMKSHPGLVLYENCMVYVSQGSESTPVWPVDTLRALLGVSSNKTYQSYKRLMEKVVRPACEEVNRVAPIQIEPVAKFAGRKVVALSFKITIRDESAANGIVAANPLHGRDTQLAMEIQERMGISFGTVVKLFDDHTDERLRAVYEYVLARQRDGKIQHGRIGGYFLRTVERATPESLMLKQPGLFLEPARSPEQMQADADQRLREDAERRQRDAARSRRERVELIWSGLDIHAQEVLHAEFRAALKEENDIVYNSLKRAGFSGVMYHKGLIDYLMTVQFDGEAFLAA